MTKVVLKRVSGCLVLNLLLLNLLRGGEYAAGMGMGGADAALTRGILAVGVNPANLGLPTTARWSVLLGGFNSHLSNNFFHLAAGQIYTGKDLSRDQGKLQRRFLSELPADGWRLTWVNELYLPLLNFSLGNKAFSSRIINCADFYISRPVLDILFGDMRKGERYNLDLRCDAMTAVEYTYTMAVPFDNMALGMSLKYLQGIGYYGLDPRRSTGFVYVDTARFLLYGEGDYYLRQSYAGRGFGIDVGIAFTNLQGWDLGISLLNLGEQIRWNSETFLSKVLKDFGLQYMGTQVKYWPFQNSDLKLDFKGESYRYTFHIDSLNGDRFFRGDSSYGDYWHSRRRITNDTSTFSVRMPVVLRISAARNFGKDLTAGIDLTASFADRFYYYTGWRLALGCEYRYFTRMPLRLGLVAGGMSGWEFDIGSGIHLGALSIDYALGLHRGTWIHTAQGVSLEVGVHYSGKRSVR